MRIINLGYLEEYANKHADVTQQLWAWYYDVRASQWSKGLDIKNQFARADPLPNNHAVFNIKNNQYRLVVAIDYRRKVVDIRFIGTHKEYDRIDAENI